MVTNEENYIRFDWAMKRMLRDKANYVVLEGFLASLLNRKFKIQCFLESEGNQEYEDDKYNRVDILAESEDKELCIIEVQNSREQAYFHRMLYGVSKAISEYVGLGKPYENVRKVYSINIVYFELGQGKDYVYHGKTEFVGAHEPHDTLKLSARQNEKFFGIKDRDPEKRKSAGDLFPEYYVLRVNDFDRVATTPLDEWIEFLKTGSISSDATAEGLPEARERLRVDSLSTKDRQAYYRHIESVRHMRSLFDTSRDEGYQEGHDEGYNEGRVKGMAEGMAEGMAKGKAEGKAEGIAEGIAEGEKQEKIATAKRLLSLGLSMEIAAQGAGLSIDEIKKIILSLP